MAAPKKPVTCASCGFANNPPGAERCASCGAKIDDLNARKRTREEELERRYQQEGVNLWWMMIAFLVQGVLTAAIIFGLPLIVTKLDLEGANGMSLCVPVWFIGGLLVGMISPGRTFIEPTVASFLVAIPTTALLRQGETIRDMPLFLYIILGAIGILFTLIGAYIGERIQLGPPPKPAD
jgi:MFS family permease